VTDRLQCGQWSEPDVRNSGRADLAFLFELEPRAPKLVGGRAVLWWPMQLQEVDLLNAEAFQGCLTLVFDRGRTSPLFAAASSGRRRPIPFRTW
jgi:hypothetical protein